MEDNWVGLNVGGQELRRAMDRGVPRNNNTSMGDGDRRWGDPLSGDSDGKGRKVSWVGDCHDANVKGLHEIVDGGCRVIVHLMEATPQSRVANGLGKIIKELGDKDKPKTKENQHTHIEQFTQMAR